MVSKRFPLFLHESCALGRDARDAIRDDASREKLHWEFAVLRFLRGASGKGDRCLVSVEADTGQKVWHVEPANETASSESSCDMYDFICFVSVSCFSVLIRTILLCTRIATGYLYFFGSADLYWMIKKFLSLLARSTNKLYIKLDYMFVYADYS